MVKKKKKKKGFKKKRNAVFSLAMCFRVYDYAKMGMRLPSIATACKVNLKTMRKWKRVHPELKVAYSLGRSASKRKAGDAYHKFVFQRLSKPMQKVWKRVTRYQRLHDRRERVELIFAKRGEAVRKHLFIHAVTVTNFNITKACKLLNVNKSMYDGWIASDPEFIKLLDELKFHQKNFYESKLLEACDNNEASAITFANRTFNADRGYGNKLEVNHTGTVTHHNVIDLDTLKLPLEILRAVNDAINLQATEKLEQEAKERAPHLKDERAVDAVQCARCGDWAAFVDSQGLCDDCKSKPVAAISAA